MQSLVFLCDKIITLQKEHKKARLFTVAISGIDGSGKGYCMSLMQEYFEARGLRVAAIGIDPWQNPLSIRMQPENTAENFYRNAFRQEDFFEQLILPLQQNKTIDLSTMLIHTHADEYYPYTYHYENPDILLIEGIFLLQAKYLPYYDYKVWIECSFETALNRAISRNSEKKELPQLIDDYHNCYFPAQVIHIEKDNPRRLANTIIPNE